MDNRLIGIEAHCATWNLMFSQGFAGADDYRERAIEASGDVEYLTAEVRRLNAWVADLQSGMYVNCVYCGHRYGPGETTPVTMADALKAHIETCPQHPMSQLRAELEQLKAQRSAARADAERP